MKQFPNKQILCEGHKEMAEVVLHVLKADVQVVLHVLKTDVQLVLHVLKAAVQECLQCRCILHIRIKFNDSIIQGVQYTTPKSAFSVVHRSFGGFNFCDFVIYFCFESEEKVVLIVIVECYYFSP
jgi:hypothetical protein